MRWLSVSLLLLVATPAPAFDWGGRLRLQVGQEFDSNAARVSEPVTADGLTRLLLDGGGWLGGADYRLGLQLSAGGKLFYHQHDENQAAWRLRAGWHQGLAPGWTLQVEAGWHETELEVHDRDYRQVEGRLGLDWRVGPVLGLQLWAGGRWFHFKPDDYQDSVLRLSHAGPSLLLVMNLEAGSGVSSSLHYGLLLGFYAGRALVSGPQGLASGPRRRRDLVHNGGLQVRQRIGLGDWGLLLLQLGYDLLVTDTNSYGSAALRHRLQLLCGLSLPAAITLQLLGRLQFTDFSDGVYLEGDLYEPEADENENALVLRVRLPLWRGLGAYAQAALYRNDFRASEVEVGDFSRYTVQGGLAWEQQFP